MWTDEVIVALGVWGLMSGVVIFVLARAVRRQRQTENMPLEQTENIPLEQVELRGQLSELMSIINDDHSLDTFEEHVDILDDMNLAYKNGNKLITELEQEKEGHSELKGKHDKLLKEHEELNRLCEGLRQESSKEVKEPSTEFLLEACRKIRDKTTPKDRLSSMRRYAEQVREIAADAVEKAEEDET